MWLCKFSPSAELDLRDGDGEREREGEREMFWGVEGDKLPISALRLHAAHNLKNETRHVALFPGCGRK